MGAWSIREIHRKEACLEYDENHCRNHRVFSGRGPDHFLREGERRIWWRIFQRFRKHGQSRIAHL